MTWAMKLFAGGSPDEVTRQYRAWWDAQPVVIIGRPKIQPAGCGWKLVVHHQPPVVASGSKTGSGRENDPRGRSMDSLR